MCSIPAASVPRAVWDSLWLGSDPAKGPWTLKDPLPQVLPGKLPSPSDQTLWVLSAGILQEGSNLSSGPGCEPTLRQCHNLYRSPCRRCPTVWLCPCMGAGCGRGKTHTCLQPFPQAVSVEAMKAISGPGCRDPPSQGVHCWHWLLLGEVDPPPDLGTCQEGLEQMPPP